MQLVYKTEMYNDGEIEEVKQGVDLIKTNYMHVWNSKNTGEIKTYKIQCPLLVPLTDTGSLNYKQIHINKYSQANTLTCTRTN